MSEENLKSEETENKPTTEVTPAAPETAPVEQAPAEATQPPAEQTPTASAPEVAQPQVIIQKERGFAHYVGFALLSVLCIIFFFAPGLAITYVINMIPGVKLGAVAAWVFTAVLSVIVWFIFKLKIKGFKKSFYFYIALCVLVFAIFIVAEILTEQTGVFANILALLTGANA